MQWTQRTAKKKAAQIHKPHINSAYCHFQRVSVSKPIFSQHDGNNIEPIAAPGVDK
jgi:hypothetical protein